MNKEDNIAKNSTVCPSAGCDRPSLTKIVLSLENEEFKRQALGHLMKAMAISYARMSIVTAMHQESETHLRVTQQQSHNTSLSILTPASISPMASPSQLTPRNSQTQQHELLPGSLSTHRESIPSPEVMFLRL